MAGIGMGVDIEGQEQVSRLLQQIPPVLRRRVGQLVEGSAIDVQRELRIAAHVGVTGQLRNSITYRLEEDGLRAIVEPTVEYAEDVEKGRGPVWLSVDENSPLRKWAELKGLNPYAVRNAIAKHGTQPHPFVGTTYEIQKPKVEEYIARGVTALVEEFNSGRI